MKIEAMTTFKKAKDRKLFLNNPPTKETFLKGSKDGQTVDVKKSSQAPNNTGPQVNTIGNSLLKGLFNIQSNQSAQQTKTVQSSS